MLQRNTIIVFLVQFTFFFLILAVPWPGGNKAYGIYFRALGRTIFSDNASRELCFETPDKNENAPGDTRIVIVNRAWMHTDGSGPVRNLVLDASGFWRPTALLVALILATPIPWQRRLGALFWGLFWIHLLLMLFLGFCIWNESAEIGLVTLSPFWKSFLNRFKEAELTQFAMAIPVTVWILVTFWRGDVISRDQLLNRNIQKADPDER